MRKEKNTTMKQRTRRYLSTLLALVLMLGLLPGTAWAADISADINALPEFSAASDTEEQKEYKISSEESLRALAQAVKDDDASGHYNMAGITFYLAEDIVLNGEWSPIGNVTYPADGFAGTFDGNGHTISGLSINSTASNQGLFGLINGATIKNLQVEGNVTSSGSYVGGIVGKVQSGTIENCSFRGSVTSSKSSAGYAGGIAGGTQNPSAITGCANFGTISGYAGGIAGYGKVSIENCYNTGEIKGTTRAGGIIGQFNGTAGTNTVENSYSIGSITLSSDSYAYSGGISGYTGTITNCYWAYLENGTGNNTGTLTHSEKIENAPGLAEKLGDAFVEDSNNTNNGWPILTWQAGMGPVQEVPGISITSTNGGTIWAEAGDNHKTSTTLSLQYENMGEETPDVTWDFNNRTENAAVWEKASNSDDYVITAGTGGVLDVTATVEYEGETYTAEYSVLVIPHFTGVEIENIDAVYAPNIAVGQTVTATVFTKGYLEFREDDYPGVELKYQWYKYDVNAGKSGPISGATSDVYTISEEGFAGADQQYKISVQVTCGGQIVIPHDTTQKSVRTKDHGLLYPVAHDDSLVGLPQEIKADMKLTFPSSVTKDGVTAQITWSGFNNVIAEDGTVIRPAAGKTTVTLQAQYTYGDAFFNNDFEIVVWSEEAVCAEQEEQEYELQQAADSLGDWYKLYPVYGTDTNVNRMVEADLAAKDYDGITVSIQSLQQDYPGAGISEDGDITYFYADPNSAPAVHFGRCQVTFLLKKDGAQLTCGPVPVILYWDADKVKETMTREIMDKVTDETILAGGGTMDSVTENLTLPKAVDGKTWALISWESSDENVISVSSENQSTADTLFAPYMGVVKPGEKNQEVTLTATFTFQLTSNVIGSEAPIVLYKTFKVTVPAMTEGDAETIRAELLAKLDAGFDAKGLTDAVTGAQLMQNDDGSYTTANDIQLPTTRDFGVDGKYYPITLSSNDPTVLAVPDVHNAARVTVYRPAVGEQDAHATLTVTLHDRDTSVTASKTFKITVPALTREEIGAELALMERVKANYFEGLNNGANAARDDVRRDLTPFFEVYEDENGQLVWVRDTEDMTGQGIVPTPIKGWEDLEAWRLFQSSNPAVIAHETLEVTRQSEAKAVTITSYLSSETLGRYGELYQSDPEKYAQYEALAGLYYQSVSAETSSQASALSLQAASAALSVPVPADDTATVLVRGTRDPSSTVPVVETIDVTFSLSGPDGTWIAPVTLAGLDETTTVYDVFRDVLFDNGYTYTRERGTYIVSITTPDDETWSEKDLGENSGWLYRVNGTIPDVYMAACGLHDGDYIQVFYTEDYEKESGYENDDWTRPEVPKEEQAEEDAVTVTRDETDGTYVVTFPEDGEDPRVVTIPDVEGQLVILVHPDGTEEVIKKSLVTDGQASFALEDGASVRIVDYTSPFDDVPREAWYTEAVDFVAGRKLFSGVSEGSFAPDQSLSRGMLVTVLYSLEEPDFSGRADAFDDVADSAWYAQGASWAVEEGIVSGYGNGLFGPDDPITREQLALMLYRYAQSLGLSTAGRDTLRSFYDSWTISPWAEDAMAWAVDGGILSGRPGGLLDPSGLTTRAEAAVMLRQLVALMLG